MYDVATSIALAFVLLLAAILAVTVSVLRSIDVALFEFVEAWE